MLMRLRMDARPRRTPKQSSCIDNCLKGKGEKRGIEGESTLEEGSGDDRQRPRNDLDLQGVPFGLEDLAVHMHGKGTGACDRDPRGPFQAGVRRSPVDGPQEDL